MNLLIKLVAFEEPKLNKACMPALCADTIELIELLIEALMASLGVFKPELVSSFSADFSASLLA